MNVVQWDDLQAHIADMKCREQEQLAARNTAITKYETILHERMALENFIAQIKRRDTPTPDQ